MGDNFLINEEDSLTEENLYRKQHLAWDITFIFMVGYFIISCIKNISNIFKGEIDDHIKISYILDYRVEGFIQRGLIGTIINTFNPDISFNSRIVLARVLYLIIALLTFAVLFLIVLKTPRNMRRYAAMLAILFLVSPGFSSYFGEALCCLNLYVFFFGVICFYLIISDRLVFLVPILCVIAMIIHTGFAFQVFPIIFLLLGIRAFLADDVKKKYVIVLLLSVVIVVLFFVYFSIVYRNIAPISAEELSDIIIEKSEGKITYFEDYVNEMLFTDDSNNNSTSQAFFIIEQTVSTLLNLIRCMILMVLYIFVSVKLYTKYKKDNVFKMLVAVLLPFTIHIIVYRYFFENDFGILNMHLISMLFMGIFGIVQFIDTDEIEMLLHSKKNNTAALMFYILLILTIGFMDKFGILY